ncbi:MAG: rhomboid family intramembrane serine protease [Candidatus Azobacteroides sp.]|nr:rhomboid family intramembrane serine protease [Candidatus Azobacteroides sp.]
MSDFFNRIELFFKNKSILSNLIAINIIVFLLVRLFVIVVTLFKWDSNALFYFLRLPAGLDQVLGHPWTLISYMFTHYGIWHILFNMLWLYWFGQIFLSFFNPRQLGGLYILGGLAGALFFILSYNFFPYFEDRAAVSYLIGASASVMAIVFGVAFYRKDYEIGLLFIGRIKIIYVAVFILILDLLSVASTNAGGHIAHVGGALFGICFAYCYAKGKDITAWLNTLIDKIFNLFKKKPAKRMKVKYRNAGTNSGYDKKSDYDYNARKNEENAEIDKILEKIKKSGYNCLTEGEKKKLFDASNK